MTAPTAANAGHDEWLDAIAAADGFYFECPNGHGSLPPRRVCPICGSREINRQPLPATGTVVTHTTVHVPTPEFEGETPYVTAIAEFGPVRLTGLVRANDPEDVAVGQVVVATVGESERGRRRLQFDIVTE